MKLKSSGFYCSAEFIIIYIKFDDLQWELRVCGNLARTCCLFFVSLKKIRICQILSVLIFFYQSRKCQMEFFWTAKKLFCNITWNVAHQIYFTDWFTINVKVIRDKIFQLWTSQPFIIFRKSIFNWISRSFPLINHEMPINCLIEKRLSLLKVEQILKMCKKGKFMRWKVFTISKRVNLN